MPELTRVAVMISGGGRTLKNFIDRVGDGTLPVQIVLVISTNAKAKGLEFAEQAGISSCVINPKGKTTEEFSREITAELDNAKPDLICMAGFMFFYKIPEHYAGKVMNIHPALLPGFGGKGMYGHHVHEAVLQAGCKITGCTVHFADNEYDRGPIIVQRAIPVEENDDVDTLAARVFEQEKIAYTQAIKLFAEKKLKILGQRVKVLL